MALHRKGQMKLQIFSVGKLSLKPAGILVEEYAQRISHYLPIEIKNFKSMEAMWQAIGGSYHVVLDAAGKTFDSLSFAKWLDGHKIRSTKSLTFMIGPAEGFPQEFKAKADFLLSLSSMTLQHELALVVLMEQIYRACTILKREPYHK